MPNERDKPRTKHREQVADPIARVFAELGVPLPTLLDDAMDGKTPNYSLQAVPIASDAAQRYEDLAALGWPRRALNEARSADATRAAVRAVNAWDARYCAIVLSGAKGTGKTVASAWWALGAKRRFRFVRSAELVRASRFDGSWDEWLKAPALCVDDLGAEYSDAKGSFVSDLDLLIDTFYSDMRPLIITTNCTSAVFLARYGERIADRINECAEWASVDGESMR